MCIFKFEMSPIILQNENRDFSFKFLIIGIATNMGLH